MLSNCTNCVFNKIQKKKPSVAINTIKKIATATRPCIILCSISVVNTCVPLAYLFRKKTLKTCKYFKALAHYDNNKLLCFVD